MLHFGLEYEFFTEKDGNLVPAYQFTRNLDGNPIVGELRTGVHTSLVDAIFELKKLKFLENKKLNEKGVRMIDSNTVEVSQSFLKALRKDRSYMPDLKKDFLEELSIYGDETGKILPTGVFKASLQISISDNTDKSVRFSLARDKEYYKEITTSNIFNYVDIIRKFDSKFDSEISKANRVKGVYAIKDGINGKRIEYRSLPNNVSLATLLTINI